MPGSDLPVIFAATAGPRRGFGHLVRCGVLADALGVARIMVLRTASRTTMRTAGRLGWRLCRWQDVVSRGAPTRPDLVVVDDPSERHTAAWVRRARRLRIPVATIHDGRSRRAISDLVIDGSARSRHEDGPRRIAGPAFAVLRDAAPAHRRGLSPQAEPPRVLVALGGGIHVRQIGVQVATAIVRRRSSVRIDLAAGFVGGKRPSLPRGCRWIDATNGLGRALATASVGVVSGGVTLYEACAQGTPAVAVAVVPAQQPAVRAVVRANGALRADLTGPDGPTRLAGVVCRLLEQPTLQRTLRRKAQQLVDGRGTARVVARLRTLMSRPQRGIVHAVA